MLNATPPPWAQLASLGAALWACAVAGAETGAVTTGGGGAPTSPGVHPGRRQAEITCSVCHLVPEPDLITKNVWKEIVLKKMAFYTGVQQLDREQNEEADLYLASGLFPSTPLVSREGWALIESYYLDSAPADKLLHGPRPEISVGLRHFQFEPPRFRREPPLTTMVTIDTSTRTILAADAGDQALHRLDANGQWLESTPVGNIPVWMKQTPQGIYLACIGHFFPKEERRGQLILVENLGGKWTPRPLLSSLPRPCHIDFADLNGDGKPEALLSMFGYLTGRFSYYEAVDSPNRREHMLLGKAGPLCSATHDFDGDGDLDLALLNGQELENLLIYPNDGRGHFGQPAEIFRRPPSFGHTYFELADMNGDGRQDFVVCNGDNGDYESPPKPYHGIRVYLAKEGGKFEESAFIPIHGVFKAMARDFDLDGDLDLAAIGFYPDYENSPRESFVYLENTGGLRFRASTFRECIAGRWMVMDTGDLDGDGDLDLVLGSLVKMPSKVPDFVRAGWESTGPSVVILRNTVRSRPAPPPN